MRIGLLLLVVPGLLLMLVFFQEHTAVTACVESGGSFDYIERLCDSERSHSFVPMLVRRPLLVNGSMLLCCAGLMMTLVALYRRR
ncbi:hypothetical protein [Nitrincola sp. MINF-07-Sa-05]|uniref:hypothetical protein n=1 Tax=Nitrincola salilacus TaxID=3400273 RepID=UPI003917C047